MHVIPPLEELKQRAYRNFHNYCNFHNSSSHATKGKNVIIGDDKSLTVDNKILAREVIKEKAPDGKKNLRIILKPRTLGGQEGSSSGDRSAAQPRPLRPVSLTGQTGPGGRSNHPGGQPQMFKSKRPEVGTWKTN